MDQTYPNGDAPKLIKPLLTRDRAKAQIHQEQIGYRFPLPHSGGVYTADELFDLGLDLDMDQYAELIATAKADARVRRIPLATLTTISGLNSEMQTQLMQVFADAREGRITAETWAELERNQKQQKEMANAFCMVAFLEPTLVVTQAEADAANSPTVLWVEEIDIRDRVNFLMSVLDPEGEAARTMAPFPEARLAGGADRQALQDAAPPVRPLVVPRGDGLVSVGVPEV
jgi:hypothetical protein